MRTLSRLKAVWGVVSGESADPYIRGRVSQAAGVALLADGLVGIENPLDGRRSRAGIFGAFLGMVFGAFFLISALLAGSASEPYEGGVTAAATVVSVQREQGRTGPLCAPVAEFEVDGEMFSALPAQSEQWCSLSVGEMVQVSYLPADPGAARILGGGPSRPLMVALGAFLFFMSGAVFVVRAVEVTAGVWLWLRGRRLVKAHPAVPLDDALDRLTDAWLSVPHRFGLPTVAAAERSPASSVTGPVAPPPPPGGVVLASPSAQEGPPAGWFADPSGVATWRWWDGTRWTDHTA